MTLSPWHWHILSQLANGQTLFALIQETERDELRSRRTSKEKLLLLSRRLMGIVSSITIQVHCA